MFKRFVSLFGKVNDYLQQLVAEDEQPPSTLPIPFFEQIPGSITIEWQHPNNEQGSWVITLKTLGEYKSQVFKLLQEYVHTSTETPLTTEISFEANTICYTIKEIGELQQHKETFNFKSIGFHGGILNIETIVQTDQHCSETWTLFVRAIRYRYLKCANSKMLLLDLRSLQTQLPVVVSN